MSKNFVLTSHAKQRLQERHDHWLLPYKTEREFELSCYEFFDRAEVSKRHFNDTQFMIRLQDKYGYDKRYAFKVWKNALFVIINDSCTTVLDIDCHATSRQHARA